jgi:Flp pilus assembly pilin Flp
VVYDISVNALNKSDEAIDLAVSIMGNSTSVGIGDTVHLVIGLSNLGPKACDAKLNYKIPVGLKLLSSQGPGVYDVASGVWSAGLLSVSDSVSLNLVLQATNIGYFVNMVSVYGDLTSTHAHAAKPIVKVFNGKWRSTAAMSDSNNRNNKASFSFDVRSPTYQTPSHEYKWPDDVPKPDKQPDKQPDLEPPWDPQPKVSNDQLPRDIRSVRDVVSGVKDAKIANWNMTIKQPEPTYDEDGSPIWVYVLAILGLVAVLAYNYGSVISEYLTTLWTGILNALTLASFYLSYLGASLEDWIVSAGSKLFIERGGYIIAAINELYSVPITGVGSTTLIGLGLRFLAEKYPILGPIVTPFIYSLEQLTYVDIVKKLGEFYNKKS